MKHKNALSQEAERWKEQYARSLQNQPERKSKFATGSGIPLSPLYTPLDREESGYLDESGFPGSFPFTRGVYPSMYRARPWTIRQYAGFGTAEETNRRFRYLLEKGQKGLSIAFDLPTQMGLDSDDPLALGEVGKVGVAVDTIEDMRALLAGLPLGAISTSMTINATAPMLLAMYAVLADEQGADLKALSGTVQNDILKEYIARGTYIFPPGPSIRLITDTFSWCAENLPNWNPISVSGYHIREAGSTAVQELAFTLANAICYVDAGVAAGLDVDGFAPRISFFFNAHNNLLEETAKFRAARRLWARIMRDRFGARKEESMRLRFHTQTAGSTLTAQQPENNIIRVTLQALAAVLGGTQSLHTNSYDEALGLPTDHTSKIALRIQQIIMEESGATDVIDPLGGSYCIESLTREIAARAEALIAEIDAMGGMARAIELGFPQREIERASYECQKALENKTQILVGVNAYLDEEDSDMKPFRVDPELERGQVERLARVKASRNGGAVAAALSSLKTAAHGGANLMPVILDAVSQRATIGEMCSALAEAFGKYRSASSR